MRCSSWPASRRPVAGGDGDQLTGPEPPWWLGQVVGVVGEPAGVVAQLPDGDPPAPGDQAGQPPLQVVVQAQAALPDQLQDQGGHERLGHAADPEPVSGPGGPVGAQVAQAAGPLPGPHPVQLPLQGGRISQRPVARDAGTLLAGAAARSRGHHTTVAATSSAAGGPSAASCFGPLVRLLGAALDLAGVGRPGTIGVHLADAVAGHSVTPVLPGVAGHLPGGAEVVPSTPVSTVDDPGGQQHQRHQEPNTQPAPPSGPPMPTPNSPSVAALVSSGQTNPSDDAVAQSGTKPQRPQRGPSSRPAVA
jgi:hypothetical protein